MVPGWHLSPGSVQGVLLLLGGCPSLGKHQGTQQPVAPLRMAGYTKLARRLGTLQLAATSHRTRLRESHWSATALQGWPRLAMITRRAASSKAIAGEAVQAVQPPQSLAPNSNAAAAEIYSAAQSCHGGTPAGQATGSNPTAVSELAIGQRPARLAARQAAQVGLVPAMPSTWPMFGILSEGHTVAQVGHICAVGCQEAL